MPLGSERTLGLAGPNGTPLIGELPAPADPVPVVNSIGLTTDAESRNLSVL